MRQNTIRTLASFSQIYTPNMINLIKRPVPKKGKVTGELITICLEETVM